MSPSPSFPSSRRRLATGPFVLLAALVLALTVAGLGHAAVQQAVQTAGKKKEPGTLDSGITSTNVRYVTYNLRARLAPEVAVRDLIKLADDGADIITLQEMGSAIRRRAVRAAVSSCSLCPYDTYEPVPAMAGATPILYRWEKFRLLGVGSKLISPATNVGKRGAGPNQIAAKYLNWVRLRDRVSGRVFDVIDSHTVASVQDRACRANQRNPKRLKLYRMHMNAMRTTIAELRAQGDAVFTSADFNVNYRCDVKTRDHLFPVYNLGLAGLHATYETLGTPSQGTHWPHGHRGTRVIDQIWYTPVSGITPVAQTILTGYASDHFPVAVDFTFTKPDATPTTDPTTDPTTSPRG